MLSQCKKKDLQYKMAAIEATGSVLHALKTDVFSDFYEIILQSVNPVSWKACISYLYDIVCIYPSSILFFL